MKKIGILGGSFDPIHNGHIHMAIQAKRIMKLEKVIFMPTGTPPHKLKNYTTPFKRMHMVELAIRNFDDFEASDIEIYKKEYCYTSDTLRILKEQYPDKELVLIVGEDSFAYIDSWHEAEVIFDLASILVVRRGGMDGNVLQVLERVKKKFKNAKIKIADCERLEISSSEIRERILHKRSLEGLVDASVASYISEQQLYKTEQVEILRDFDVEKVKSILGYMLKPSRLEHSIGVMKTAMYLARVYDEDVKKAQIAGILHDCAKNFSEEQMIEQCKKRQIVTDEISLKMPSVLHQYLGADIAEKEFGVTDDEILGAIKYHTTGYPVMTGLEKIVYIADLIEPTRDKHPFDGLKEIREMAEKNLDKTMIMALDASIRHVIKKGQILHPNTVLCRNNLLIKISEN